MCFFSTCGISPRIYVPDICRRSTYNQFTCMHNKTIFIKLSYSRCSVLRALYHIKSMSIENWVNCFFFLNLTLFSLGRCNVGVDGNMYVYDKGGCSNNNTFSCYFSHSHSHIGWQTETTTKFIRPIVRCLNISYGSSERLIALSIFKLILILWPDFVSI